MVDTYTYDVTQDAGKVRLLAQDFDMTNPIFTDDEIQAFLNIHDGVVRYAAANALQVIAASEAYTSKMIKSLSLEQNGPAVAKALMETAAAYIERENAAPADWAELVYDDFSEREAILNAMLRRQF